MKTKQNIRTQIGLTQVEMAALLGISRSHWSMIETGKRQMPPGAMQLVAPLLASTLENQKKDRAAQRDAQVFELAERKKHLEKLLKVNEHQRLRLARDIESLQRKHDKGSIRQHFKKSLENDQARKQGAPHFKISHRGQMDAERKSTSAALVKLDIRRMLLDAERDALRSQLTELPTKQVE